MEDKKKSKTKRDDYSQLNSPKDRSKKTNVFGKMGKKKKKGSEKAACSQAASLSPFTGERGIFGVPLKLAIARMRSNDGVPLPFIVRQCIDCINERGLMVEGIHRISAPKVNLDKLEDETNARKAVIVEDVHEASGLLKRFLRKLPENILTDEKKEMFETIAAKCPCGFESTCHCLVADMLKAELCRLPTENYHLLAYVFLHAHRVLTASAHNKMGLAALGLILQAALNISQSLVRIFLLNACDQVDSSDSDQHIPIVYLFNDIQIKKYVEPKSPKIICEEELSECEVELSLEEMKQRSRLNALHFQIEELRELNLPTRATEDQLWDVQTAITMISRKLKCLRNTKAEAMSERELETRQTLEVFEEKQLMATCTVLRDDIALQKDEIIALERAILAQQANSAIANVAAAASPPAAADQAAFDTAGGDSTDADYTWRELYVMEEQRRDELLGEVTQLRNECCTLRAKIELELGANKRALLVTRF